MRKTTEALVRYYLAQLKLSGKALEIGGHKLAKSASKIFEQSGLEFHDMNLAPSDIANTIVADVTDCKQIADGSFDVVFSSDVFEHVARPWKAAEEITRILKPGGLVITVTLWAWRNHPCPIDYWRFSPECLEFLFADLDCLEKGYDLSRRRHNEFGFWKNGMDSVPEDELGGWREHWASYHVGSKGKPSKPVPKPFKDTDDPLARFLRMDTQGTVTKPGPKLPNTDAAQFCGHCGTSLRLRRCAGCRATVPLGARFCSQCGREATP